VYWYSKPERVTADRPGTLAFTEELSYNLKRTRPFIAAGSYALQMVAGSNPVAPTKIG
jgi:hypothetical protein